MLIKGKNNKKVKITSSQNSVKGSLNISNKHLNENVLTSDQVISLKYMFDEIETIERFKKHD